MTIITMLKRMNDVRPKIVIAVIVSVFAIGVVRCGERKPLSTREIIEQVNASGKITDAQTESLSKVEVLDLDGLTSITDAQAESLSKVRSLHISRSLQPLIDKYKNQ
tara:strand:+ start:1932 stop:2252 length:321 start_codon:yes stop_codon:yes gene_type:complete